MLDVVKDLLILMISSSLVSNVVLSQFLGLCPFLGVSRKVDTALGMGGAVISAVPLCHGIGALRGLEMVEVEGATGELDTNFEGKLEAAWTKLRQYDFVCLHLEAPDECTHNGDLPGKVQAIEWLDSRLTAPLLERLESAGLDHRVLLLSDHKTLTATRGHDGSPVPFLLYDSRRDAGRGGVYDEEAGESGPLVENGSVLLDMLFDQSRSFSFFFSRSAKDGACSQRKRV